jgi:ADP-heptose:LPS heptosyltransferase
MLTAAIRDLHQTYPGEFETDVRCDYPDLWLHNPYLSPIDERDKDVCVIEVHYPLIHHSNRLPVHFLHGFVEYLSDRFQRHIKITAFKGDIHLSELERTECPIKDVIGSLPFWLIVAGGKFDFTVKWWSTQRFQRVVDHFRGVLQFVQSGQAEHHHPLLEGVVDMRGKTSLRDLIRLIHFSSGVVCPVTLAMHLCAAVETRTPDRPLRPCVVIAGGREPASWGSYPGHQFLHTIGMLPCCADGGCWLSRTFALNDGSEHDSVYRRCLHVVGDLPKCMDMITVEQVIERIEMYLEMARVDANQVSS